MAEKDSTRRGMSPLEVSMLLGMVLFLGLLVLESLGQIAFLTRDLPPGGSSMISEGINLCMSDIIRFFMTVFLVYMGSGLLAGALAHLFARGVRGKGRWFRWVFLAELFLIPTYLSFSMAIIHPQFFAIKPFYKFFPVDWITAWTGPWMYHVLLTVWVAAHLVMLYVRCRSRLGEFMRSRRFLSGLAAVVVLVVAVVILELPPGSGSGPAVHDPKRPHVFFYCIDALRLDRTSHYGYPRRMTPNIDAFMDDAVIFENAFTPLAKTYPSWVSFLTSTGLMTNGVRFALPGKARRQPPLETAAKVLGRSGWRTSFFTDDSRYSFMEDWAGFADVSQPEPGFMNYFAEYSHYYLLVGELADTRTGNLLFPMTRHNHALSFYYSSRIFYEDFLAYIGRETGKGPVASFSHHVGIHYPGAAPWPYYSMFTDPAYRGGNKYMYRVYFMRDINRGHLSEISDSNQHNQELYDGMVAMMDDKFGMFTAALQKLGVYDDSLIVLFSDHGESFNERHPVFRHFLPMHGVHLKDDFQNRCFVAVRFPGSMRGQVTKNRVTALARVMDLAPTALESLGLAAPASFEGVSFLPVITRGAEPPALELYMENDINPSFLLEPNSLALNLTMTQMYQLDPGMRTLGVDEKYLPGVLYTKERALRTNRWKLLRVPMISGSDYRLYEPKEDPFQLNDESESRPDEFLKMLELMKPFLARDKRILMMSPKDMGVVELDK